MDRTLFFIKSKKLPASAQKITRKEMSMLKATSTSREEKATALPISMEEAMSF